MADDENDEATGEGVDVAEEAEEEAPEEKPAEDEEPEGGNGQPRFLTCHLCGQQQMLRSFYPHIEKCKKLVRLLFPTPVTQNPPSS